jgi:hypothetical protein
VVDDDDDEGLWVEVLAAEDRFLRGGSLPDGGSGFRIFLQTMIASNSNYGRFAHTY